ncbi:MAG: copper resistance protein NlpE N-terminal domain-containing protein [Bacteroidetes bacterium]|nr:copper resistance protein NlpE N-terminal domain-containing protein [Bacteroidota bacterium]
MFKYLSIALLLFACTPSKQVVVAKEAHANVDSLMNLINATQWAGVLPCADCSGIQYELTLRNNQSYHEKMTYEGKNVNPFSEEGSWSISPQGKLVLSSSSNSKMQFLIEDKKLRMLDQDGKIIKGNLADNYTLYPKKNEEENNWIALSARGINFVATGNEPFWSLEIIVDSSMVFKTPEGFEFTAPFVKGENAADANITRYRSVTANGELAVQISKQKCVNSMSGQVSDYQVSIRIKKATDASVATYNGCGNYIGNYRLNDIWGLTSIGGVPLTMNELRGGMPTLDLQLTTKKVYGFAGCNRFTGNILFTDKTISFDEMATTMRSCQNQKVEDRFLKTLSRATLDYKIEGLNLFLGKGKTQLKFKKLD